jgi:hypothetical protein
MLILIYRGTFSLQIYFLKKIHVIIHKVCMNAKWWDLIGTPSFSYAIVLKIYVCTMYLRRQQLSF